MSENEFESQEAEREDLIKRNAFFDGIKFILSDSDRSREFIMYFEIMNRTREIKSEILEMQKTLDRNGGGSLINSAGVLANKVSKFRIELQESIISLAIQSYNASKFVEAID